jgi:glyoxylase-like metal-dependent hydrolase (beta-lactamase superfamily II)
MCQKTGRLIQISPHLFMFKDTSNVFAVVAGDAGLIIDAGSGQILEALKAVGVEKVEWILHTHHHRDQCWGDWQLIEHGAKVAVPEYELYLFEHAETFWETKRIYDNYNARNTFLSVGRDIHVAATLNDYDTFDWRGYSFYVLPAKGHTNGSSALIADIDGQRVAFTGDLMIKGGKLYQLHAMEYDYGDMKGVPYTIQSIQALRKQNPQLMLPSHGEPIDDPLGDIDRLQQRLMALVDLQLGVVERSAGTRAYLPEMRMINLSTHLLWSGPWTFCNFYVIKSDSGRALFIDYGHSLYQHVQVGRDREDWETMRFVEHHLDELREAHGITQFDVVIPTHIHDDHTCGIPFLQRHHGVECWALREVGRVLENPSAWSSTPCVFPKPIRVDRWLDDGERFSWEEYKFEIYHAPGQTEYHSTIAVVIDGQKVAFTGDNIFERKFRVHYDRIDARPLATTVFRNSFQFWMHRKCKDVMKRIMPDLICPGHHEVLYVDPPYINLYSDLIDQKERVFRDLVGGPEGQYVDLFWARLLPYQAVVEPGAKLNYTLLIRNNFGSKVDYEARLLAADGKTVVGDGRISLDADERGELALTLEVAQNHELGRHLITAELLIDGQSQGPIVEALIDVV